MTKLTYAQQQAVEQVRSYGRLTRKSLSAGWKHQNGYGTLFSTATVDALIKKGVFAYERDNDGLETARVTDVT